MSYKTLLNSPPRLQGLTFSNFEKEECLSNGSVLRASIEFGPACNLKCVYCYASEHNSASSVLTYDELSMLINQLSLIGARSIVLLGGGEPLMYPFWKRVVQEITKLNITPIIFTNGVKLTEEAIQFLIEAKANIVLKLDSLDPSVQNFLSGNKGVSKVISTVVNNLFKYGFADKFKRRLAIHTVICRQNVDGLPKLWCWARDNGIIPLFQLITPQGRGAQQKLHLDINEVYDLFSKLLDIDQVNYGYTWIMQPPYVADTCDKLLYNIYIKYTGQVSPCVGMDIDLGNIRNETLLEIINSQKAMKFRKIMDHITGKCTICSHSGNCYGCRGTAYEMTNDPFGSDPMCWM